MALFSQMVTKNHKHFLFLTLSIYILTISCNPSRHLPDKNYLLTKQKIILDHKYKKQISSSDLEKYYHQVPNKRFFGVIPFKASVYNSLSKKKSTRFRTFLLKSFAEKPVVLDNNLTIQTVSDMKIFLAKSGFFNAEVKSDYKYHKKKAKTYFSVFPGEPYMVNLFTYNIPDQDINSLIRDDQENALVKQGMIYNAYTLDSERDRITMMLKENGYFEFSKEYIYYEVDSTRGKNQVNISVHLKNMTVKDSAGTESRQVPHKKYSINNVFVYPDYNNIDDPVTSDYDTLLVPYSKHDSATVTYLYHKAFHIRPAVINRTILTSPGKMYRQSDFEITQRRIKDLGIFSYYNISFTKPPNDQLDMHLRLARASLNFYSVDFQGTNSGGDLGLGGNLSYQANNVFRGGEILKVKVRGAVEAQKLNKAIEDDKLDNLPLFNTYETGAEANLSFPRILFPINQEKFSRLFSNRTNLNVLYSMQNHPEFKRYLTNLSFNYNWFGSSQKKHIFSPFDISMIKIFPTAEFDSILNVQANLRLRNQYKDHLISSMHYTFTFSNQQTNKAKNFIYFMGRVESSGLLLKTLSDLRNNLDEEKEFYTLFNIRFAQFVRFDFDFRHYFFIDRKNSLVTRVNTGVGIPYGNSIVLPYEKGFFGGGANGIRGWQLRSLGPGTYNNDTLRIERIGDVLLQGNFEYRFPINTYLQGALFMDIGNIWLVEENSVFPGGRFDFGTFYREFAVDAGLGFRFDLNFFVLRLDLAKKLRDPSLPGEDKWASAKTNWTNFLWNFGIGYPF